MATEPTEGIEYIDLNLYDSHDKDQNVINDQLHLFCQEIELAIKIAPNQIWGVKESINLKRYLYNRYVTITQMKNEIKNFITKHCAHASLFDYKLSVETLKDNNKDLIYIVFSIYTYGNNNEGKEEFLQKFLLG